MTTLDSILKSRHYFANNGPSSQSYDFSSSHVWMRELDYKESWAPKNWWTVGLEKILESTLDCKEVQPVNAQGNQSWIFSGRTDAEAEVLILWLPDAKNWLIRKDPDSGKDWRQEKGARGWDGWMAPPTWWTWVWASSGSWWWTGKPGMLQSMGLQKVVHDWATELNWIHKKGSWNMPSSTVLNSSSKSKLSVKSLYERHLWKQNNDTAKIARVTDNLTAFTAYPIPSKQRKQKNK